jgi:PhzF family phenazine biosynthesis protein
VRQFLVRSESITMPQSVVQVDAFTAKPFAGNPAAVCVLSGPADAAWMQDVAREMNLSETAFVHRLGSMTEFALRWFTPASEVDLCGHATLATAHALWEEGHLDRGAAARFRTRSGLLIAARRGEWIELDFPAEPAEPMPPPEELANALGAQVRWAGRNRFDWLVELDSEAAVRGLAPRMTLLEAIPTRGIIVTSRAETAGFDFVSRFFAPRLGVPEDPVCGSAHCCLAPYWAPKLKKTAMVGYPASPRGGVVRVRLEGPRVVLGGQAVTVLRGELVT